MRVRTFALVVFALGPLATPVWAAHGYWLEAQPADAAETALREALLKNAFAGAPATAEALRQVSAAHPGTSVSGLAQLAAGLMLLDAGKAADAIPSLHHADVARTPLQDYALKALAEALEATGDAAGAAPAYVAAADAHADGPLACPALLRAADAFGKAGQADKALATLNRVLTACPDQSPRALLAIGGLEESRRDPKAAAQAYDRIVADHPASAEAPAAEKRLRVVGGSLPPLAPEVRAARDGARAQALYDAGRFAEAAVSFRAVLARKPQGEAADLAHMRLGRCYLATGRLREAEAELGLVAAGSPYAAEAAFHRAKSEARRTAKPDAFEAVATGFPGTPWGEEALLSLANHYQKDQRDDEAVPYYRRLLADYADGRYADRATWHVAWFDYRAARYEDAAQALERAARLRADSFAAPGFLYWAGRARHELGQSDRARQLLEEVRQRFEHAYYGLRAVEALAKLPGPAPAPAPVLRRATVQPERDIPEPQLTRVRQLLLIDRLDEAGAELLTVPPTTTSQATIAWVEWRRGRLRPAITAMKRAYPEYVGEAGDALPEEVWKILYPIDYSGLLQQKATEQGLDPSLVAALVCQESTFNPGALSRAGARGLMQIIPQTGRKLAQALRARYSAQSLFDPATSIDFGTHYLHDMLDRVGGRVERALAAYNAGPHRVDAWTAGRPDISAEEFIENIPFTETRFYVMTILANQEQYRRIYSFPTATVAAAPAPAAAASEPR